MKLTKLNKLVVLLSFISAFALMEANEPDAGPDSRPIIDLDAYVVTATRTELSYRDAPASVTLIDETSLELAPTPNLIGALSDIAGFNYKGRGVGGRKVFLLREWNPGTHSSSSMVAAHQLQMRLWGTLTSSMIGFRSTQSNVSKSFVDRCPHFTAPKRWVVWSTLSPNPFLPNGAANSVQWPEFVRTVEEATNIS